MQTDYLGAWQYEGDSLRWLSHADGRVLRFVQRDAAGQVLPARYVHEYTLKDHLGNLRAAVKRGETRRYEAGFDFATDPDGYEREKHLFDSVSVSPPVRHQVPLQFSFRGDGVARLTAGTADPAPVAALKQVSVAKGDRVRITAQLLYDQPVQHNWNFVLAGFVNALVQQQPAPAVTGEGGSRRPRVLPLLSLGLALAEPLTHPDPAVPRAYVRLLVFCADSNLVEQAVTPLTAEIIAKQAGYVVAYVANESKQLKQAKTGLVRFSRS
ncbi:hypothetical protein [Solirubrum puertoriconensis]|uniref:Uncharacterized protein n=1 Tax=Solirubrum puertoriconensis TaxID=1751427 RepID=A0A9X0HIB6_SOLP1|nr:hypothetical protein [Solirubrum puertoriconensis]KUG06362.1 hypothetical protein ASU33_03120 [Solirubrum puertoriconensis]